MTERSRNIAVGLTVLVALAMLAGMVLIFAGLPQLFQRGYEIKLVSDSTHEIREGDSVHVSGMRAGRIVEVGFTDPADPTAGVTIVARIDGDIRIPSNAKAVVFTRGFVGSPYVALVPEGPQPEDQPFLPTHPTPTLQIEHRGTGLLPGELGPALEGLAKLTENLNELIAPEEAPTTAAADGEGPATEPAPTPSGVKGTIEKLNRTLDALYVVLGDVENQRNIQDSLANIRQAAQAATEAMNSMEDFAVEAQKAAAGAADTLSEVREATGEARQRMGDVADKLIESSERISTLMSTVNRIALKIESGDGTAGRLVSDPELYNNLLDATREMSRLMKEFRTLVETWKESGVQIKVQ
ncbi:MAG: MlaD family protein [Phycisphaerae bacterium]